MSVGEIVEDGDEEYSADELMDEPVRWRPVPVNFIGEAVQEASDPPVRRAINVSADYWTYEDYQHPLEDWHYEVTNNDTRLGYREWVAAKREADTR